MFTKTELEMIAILAHQGIMARMEVIEKATEEVPGAGLSLDEAKVAFMEVTISMGILEMAVAMAEKMEDPAPRSRVARIPN